MGAWIDHEGRPRMIEDLRQRTGGGRIAHLAGGGVASIDHRSTVFVYTVGPAPVPRTALGTAWRGVSP
jgi:hypothetical protein